LKFNSSIRFPEDEGLHHDAPYEWWYLNNHLTSSDGTDYSAVVCFFPSHLLTMLADVTNKKLIYNIGTQYLDFDSSTKELDVRYGRSWWKQNAYSPFPSYTMHVDTGGFCADFTMKAIKRPMLIDGTGLIREGLLGKSYYYARPRLQIEGSINVRDELKKVSGIAWIDRQWGDWDWTGIGSWRWFSFQFPNSFDALLIQITHPFSDKVVSQSFTVSDANGDTRVIKNYTVKEGSKWKSPESNQIYGNSWRIESPGLCDLEVVPVFDEQESMKGLWEGVCEVRGTFGNADVKSRAYAEQSHGRIYGVKRKLTYLPLGIASHVLRNTFSTRTNLVDRAVEVLHAD
jgi:predicted secreted hydrolase